MRNEARRVKEALSSHPYAELLLGLPTGMVTQRVTRVEFESLVEPYVAGSVELLSRAVSDAGLNIGRLDAVYLAGGASCSPLVERLVSQAFPGVTVSRRGDPKTAVALGATHGRAVASGTGRGSAPPHPAADWYRAGGFRAARIPVIAGSQAWFLSSPGGVTGGGPHCLPAGGG